MNGTDWVAPRMGETLGHWGRVLNRYVPSNLENYRTRLEQHGTLESYDLERAEEAFKTGLLEAKAEVGHE